MAVVVLFTPGFAKVLAGFAFLRPGKKLKTS
jgi:hypothetical protein